MNIGQVKEVKIETLVHGGDGLGYIDGQVVFVPLSARADHLQVCLNFLNNDYLRAEIAEIIQPSPSRIAPRCEVFGECGGCQWQHIDYPEQLQAKMEIVNQALVREGKMTEYQLLPIIPSPLTYYYRHRMQFSVTHHDRTPHVGLYKRNTHEPIEMKECYLAHPLINSFLHQMREVFLRLDNRFIQGIDVTVDGEGQKLLLVLHFKRGEIEEQKRLYQEISESLPNVAGAILRTEEYKKAQNSMVGQQQIIYPTINYKLFIGPETFIQVNKEGNQVLVQTVLNFASEIISQEKERLKILELHSGAGNFTLPLSRMARELIGIESCEASVELAKKSSWAQDITNCQLFSKSDLKGVRFLVKNNHSFDFLLVDPPRCGCKEILEYIPQLGIRHIIYVSCNPSTLARDLNILTDTLGYQLEKIQPIDMFPQTHHVECVAKLERVKS